MKYRMTIFPALEQGNKSVKFGYETAEQMETARDTAIAVNFERLVMARGLSNEDSLYKFQKRVSLHQG